MFFESKNGVYPVYVQYCAKEMQRKFAKISTGNIGVLLTEGFFYSARRKVYYSAQLNEISEADFLWEFVDCANNKCLFSALPSVCIKRVELFRKKYIKDFPQEQRKLSVLSGFS